MTDETRPSPWLHVVFNLFRPFDTDSVNRGVAVVQTAADALFLSDIGCSMDAIDTGVLPPFRRGNFPSEWPQERREEVLEQAKTITMAAARQYVRHLKSTGVLTDQAWVDLSLSPYNEPGQEVLVAYIAEQWDRIAVLAQDLIDARGGVLTNPWMPPPTSLTDPEEQP
jgi:hypothetical protein